MQRQVSSAPSLRMIFWTSVIRDHEQGVALKGLAAEKTSLYVESHYAAYAAYVICTSVQYAFYMNSGVNPIVNILRASSALIFSWQALDKKQNDCNCHRSSAALMFRMYA